MRTGQLFWGTFLLTLGVIIMLVKLDALFLNWDFVWDIWPVIFIIWGLSVILKNSKLRPVTAILSGLFIAVFVYGVFFDITDSVSFFEESSEEGYVREFSQDYDSTITYANLEINLGVGTFLIRNTTDELIFGKSRGVFSDYSFDTNYKDSTVWIQLETNDKNIQIFKESVANKVDIKLNRNPVWDLELTLGAAKAYFDLTPFKVDNLVLNAGAANTKVKFGDRSKTTYMNVNMGAAGLEILIPRSSGCKITGEMFLVAKDLKGFTKTESGYYVTDNYETAENKILIDFDSGISKLEITKY